MALNIFLFYIAFTTLFNVLSNSPSKEQSPLLPLGPLGSLKLNSYELELLSVTKNKMNDLFIVVI